MSKDDNTIDISHMTPKEYKTYMRRLEQLASCPCNNCTKVCDRASKIAECDAYQLWLDYQYQRKDNRRKR